MRGGGCGGQQGTRAEGGAAETPVTQTEDEGEIGIKRYTEEVLSENAVVSLLVRGGKKYECWSSCASEIHVSAGMVPAHLKGKNKTKQNQSQTHKNN